MDVFVTKGTKVRVSRYLATSACLAGGQPKVGATYQDFVGTVRHVRGDDPIAPREVAFWVEPDTEIPGAEKCEKCGALEIGPISSRHLYLP